LEQEPKTSSPDLAARHTEGRSSARWVGLVLLLGCFFLAYWRTLYWLVDRWFADPYMGGALVIAPLVAYLIWQRREEVAALPVRGTAWGWPLLILAAGMHWLSIWIGYPHSSALSLVPLAVGVTIVGWGTAAARRLAAPLALIVFVTPVPLVLDPLTFPLRTLSTGLAAILPKATGMQCTVVGTSIHMAGYSLMVDIPCSGLRSIWSLLFGASLAAFLLSFNWWQTGTLLLLSFPLGMGDNVLRIDTSVVLGNIFGGAVAEHYFHSFAGLVCFSISLLILVGLAGGIARWVPKAEGSR
jgi:exosortase